jgi:hypothetical protein
MCPLGHRRLKASIPEGFTLHSGVRVFREFIHVVHAQKDNNFNLL